MASIAKNAGLRRNATRVLNNLTGRVNQNGNTSTSYDEKQLVCPYQYMYYYMLLECTSDNAFKIIGPKH